MTITINGTTGIAGVDGSAATPAVQGADTNTGVFYGTDIVAISTGGTERMRVDASGNVGIGTSSPTVKLDVTGSIKASVSVTSAGDFIGGGASGAAALYSNAAGGLIVCRGSSSTNDIEFSTNSTERMRIDSSGNLMIQDTTSYARLTVTHAGAVEFGITTNNTNTGGAGQTSIGFRRNGAFVGTITTTSSATAYNTSSDYRLKNSVAPMTTGVATIAALKPVTYKWNVDDSSGEGFIAHELQEIIPLAVIGAKDEKDAEGNPVHQGVDYSKIVVHLVAAIQEQQAMITALTARITALEATP